MYHWAGKSTPTPHSYMRRDLELDTVTFYQRGWCRDSNRPAAPGRDKHLTGAASTRMCGYMQRQFASAVRWIAEIRHSKEETELSWRHHTRTTLPQAWGDTNLL
jgi:hypothetical protein